MVFSTKIQEKINVLFSDDDAMREKLLVGNDDAIREIAYISQKGIKAEDIVVAFESDNRDAITEIYNNAKKMIELQKLYRELCLEFYKKSEKVSDELNSVDYQARKF